MTKSKILLVSIRGSYNAAKKCIKKGSSEIEYRKTLRDMTVQYWPVVKLAPVIGTVCGIRGNYIFSAFEVNKQHSYDIEFRGKVRKVAFNCDVVRDDLIGIRLPDKIAFNGGNMLRSLDLEEFYDLISSQYETGEIIHNKQKVYAELAADGLTIDNESGKRQDYRTFEDYAQRVYGNERDQRIRKAALNRSKHSCELFDYDRCDFCINLTMAQRDRVEVHHIEELHIDPVCNDQLDNLIVICKSLHRRYHFHMCNEDRKRTKDRFLKRRQNINTKQAGE